MAPPDYGPAGPVTDAAALGALVRGYGAEVRSLRAQARTRVWSKDGSAKVQDLLALARPDKLRIDVLSFFGQPLASLASDGQRFTYLDVEHGAFHAGPATAASMGAYLPVRIAPADAVALLLGSVPPISDAASATLELAPEGYTLALVDPAGDTFVVTVAPRQGRPLAICARRDGRTLWTARFEEFGDDGLPRHVEIADPQAGAELDYQDVELNPDLAADTFVVEPPPR